MQCLLLPAVLLFAPITPTPLFAAVTMGDADTARHLLAAGAAVNELGANGLAALHAAALADNADMVALLTSAGADLTVRTSKTWSQGNGRAIPTGSTALQAASLRGRKNSQAALHRALDHALCEAVRQRQLGLAKPLLDAGASAQQRHCGDGDNPLTQAALAGQMDLATLLMAQGADANSGAPLRRAFEGGNPAMLKLLMAHGADPKVAWQGRDFLPYTWRERDVANFKLLMEAGLGANLPGADTMTPFHHVARNAELVRYVLAHGGNANATNPTGFTVLHAACMGPDATPVGLLLDANARIDPRQDDGLTPLARACASGRVEVVKLLLQRGADAKTRSNDGTGLVTWGALSGNPNIIRAVAAAGAPVNDTDADGSTALHWVNNEAAAGALLDLGADVNHADHGGQTPLHRAAARENSDTVTALLIRRGANVNAVDAEGETPLHVALPANVQQLIDAHADINRRDKQGRTPLLAQLEQGDEGAMALLKAGADTHVEDAHGLTALHWAALGNAARSAQELLKRGLNVNAVTKSVFHYKTDDVDQTFPAATTPVGLCGQREVSEDDDGESEDVLKTLSEAGGKKR